MLLHQLLNNYKLNINFARSGGGYESDSDQDPEEGDIHEFEEELDRNLTDHDLDSETLDQIIFDKNTKTFELLNQDQKNEILENYLRQYQCYYYDADRSAYINILERPLGQSPWDIISYETPLYYQTDQGEYQQYSTEDILTHFYETLLENPPAYFWDLYPSPKFKQSTIATLNHVSRHLLAQPELSPNQDLQDIRLTLDQLQDPNAIEVLTPDAQCIHDYNGQKQYKLKQGPTSFKVATQEPQGTNDESTTEDNLAKKIYFRSRDEIAKFQADFIEDCKSKVAETESQGAQDQPSKIYVTRGVMFEYQDDHPNNKKHAEIYFMYNSKRKECHQYVRQFNQHDESLLMQHLKNKDPLIYTGKDTNTSQTNNAITSSCADICKATIAQDISQTLKKITEKSNLKQGLKKRINRDLDSILPLPLGITVKRNADQQDSTITVTRKTTEGNTDVANSEYIEVQDEVFKNLTPEQQKTYNSGQVKRFFIRVHFNDDGKSDPEIDKENVYYFNDKGEKIKVPLTNLANDENFKDYHDSYLKDSHRVNPQDSVNHFTEQFKNTYKRIRTCQITQMENGEITTTITESQNEKEKKQTSRAGDNSYTLREPTSIGGLVAGRDGGEAEAGRRRGAGRWERARAEAEAGGGYGGGPQSRRGGGAASWEGERGGDVDGGESWARGSDGRLGGGGVGVGGGYFGGGGAPAPALAGDGGGDWAAARGGHGVATLAERGRDDGARAGSGHGSAAEGEGGAVAGGGGRGRSGDTVTTKGGYWAGAGSIDRAGAGGGGRAGVGYEAGGGGSALAADGGGSWPAAGAATVGRGEDINWLAGVEGGGNGNRGNDSPPPPPRPRPSPRIGGHGEDRGLGGDGAGYKAGGFGGGGARDLDSVLIPGLRTYGRRSPARERGRGQERSPSPSGSESSVHVRSDFGR